MISREPDIEQRVYDPKTKTTHKRPVRQFRRETTVKHGVLTASTAPRNGLRAVWSEAEKVFKTRVA